MTTNDAQQKPHVVQTCSEQGCSKSAHLRGWCRPHYERWRRHGDPQGGRKFFLRGTPEERFWNKVDRRGPDECWNWLGAKNNAGYGHIGIPTSPGGRYSPVLAHRFSYELHGGTLPPSQLGSNTQTIDHLCYNRLCVNPAHLEVVTHKENLRRRRPRTHYSIPKRGADGRWVAKEIA